MYNIIARFVEAGETPEHAVVHEVAEEVGIFVNTIRYRLSQPEPLAHSLMVGFTAFPYRRDHQSRSNRDRGCMLIFVW